MQLHELSAGVGHVVHLQVRGSAEHPRDHARSQREPGGVHEVQQQGDAGWVQGVREGHGAEMLLAAATTPLKQHAVGVQRVEEAAEDRERESVEACVKKIIKRNGLDLWTNLQATSTAQCARNCTLPTIRVVSVRMLRCRSSFRFSSTSLEWRVNSFTYPTTGAATCASGALSILYDSNLSIIRICAEKASGKRWNQAISLLGYIHFKIVLHDKDLPLYN